MGRYSTLLLRIRTLRQAGSLGIVKSLFSSKSICSRTGASISTFFKIFLSKLKNSQQGRTASKDERLFLASESLFNREGFSHLTVSVMLQFSSLRSTKLGGN